MLLSRLLINNYARDIRTLQNHGRSRIQSLLSKMTLTRSVETRIAVQNILDAFGTVYGNAISTRTVQFYSDVREQQLGERGEPEVIFSRPPEATEIACKALVTEPEKLEETIPERFDYEMRKVAATTVTKNGQREKERVRYARVPTGIETCAFCVMLASRGFVYLSAATAGDRDGDGIDDGHYHANCDCIIVPSFTPKDDPRIEGYDPDELYEQYQQAVDEGRLKIKHVKRFTNTAYPTEITTFKGLESYLRHAKSADDLKDRKVLLYCHLHEKDAGYGKYNIKMNDGSQMEVKDQKKLDAIYEATMKRLTNKK